MSLLSDMSHNIEEQAEKQSTSSLMSVMKVLEEYRLDVPLSRFVRLVWKGEYIGLDSIPLVL